MSRFGTLELQAREKVGAPENWTLFMVECLPKDGSPTQTYHMQGAIEGKHKNGNPKWLKPYTDVYISPAENDAWSGAWEKRTGSCRECMGKKQVSAGWSRAEGQKWRACSRCNGTGSAPAPNDEKETA